MVEGVGGVDAAGPGRVVLLVTSPRVAPGLLSWPAWQALREAAVVLVAEPDDDWSEALGAAGVRPRALPAATPAARAAALVEAAAGGSAVWLGSPDGDPGLTDALAELLSRRAIDGVPPEVELVPASHDVPGSRLLDLVAVMDRLRSPGGCPWDAEQTHTSLLPYLLEESHEVVEAVEALPLTGDREHLREELGDLLLQVVFHARVAQEDPQAPFGIDDVAAGIVAKLVRRHPHVFAGASAADAGEVAANWEEIKAAEKPRRGPFEGIPVSLPALARATKMLARLERAGTLDDDLLARAAAGDEVALRLLRLVQEAGGQGADAEAALRGALVRLAALKGDAQGADGQPDG
ncbi:MAG TPA: MazG family protein [Kineosporiaceae bacterium]|nr:MazG family protein [Kineosporiaceae bacterium]